MPTWHVMGEQPDEALATVESLPDGTVLIHSPVPLATRKAEELRWAIGAAIGVAVSGDSGRGDDGGFGHSQGGESDA